MATAEVSDPIQKTLDDFKERVLELFPDSVDEIVLFGSYARGEATPDSDLDDLVVVNWTDPDAPDKPYLAKLVDPRWKAIMDAAIDVFIDRGPPFLSPLVIGRSLFKTDHRLHLPLGFLQRRRARRLERVTEILETLVALGQAGEAGEGLYSSDRLWPVMNKNLKIFSRCVFCILTLAACAPATSLSVSPASSPSPVPSYPPPLFTSSPVPAPSITPTLFPPTAIAATTTDTPAPTTSSLPLPNPLAAAASFEFAGWSPDGRWVAFWTFSQKALDDLPDNDGGPYDLPGVLHFNEIASGKTCEYPDPAMFSYRHPIFAWQDDGRAAVIGSDGIVRVGVPCTDESTSLEQIAGLIALGDPSISPAHKYRVENIEQAYDEETGIASYATIVTDAATGQEKIRVDWDIRLELGWLYQPKWVTDELLLITESTRGPLLVTVEGEITEAASELFAVENCSELLCANSLHAAVSVERETGVFHLALYSFGEIMQPVRLYHSESGDFEILPFEYFWYTHPFSPAGKWLMLVRANDTSFISSTTLVRGIDPVGSKVSPLEDNLQAVVWSPDEGKVAFSNEQDELWVQTFPEKELLAYWDLNPARNEDLWAAAAGWSPDGMQLAIVISWYEIVQGTTIFHSELHILQP